MRPNCSWWIPATTRSFGARPLKRAIQRYIEDPLAMEILEGNFQEGDRILIDKGMDNKLVFRRQ